MSENILQAMEYHIHDCSVGFNHFSRIFQWISRHFYQNIVCFSPIKWWFTTSSIFSNDHMIVLYLSILYAENHGLVIILDIPMGPPSKRGWSRDIPSIKRNYLLMGEKECDFHVQHHQIVLKSYFPSKLCYECGILLTHVIKIHMSQFARVKLYLKFEGHFSEEGEIYKPSFFRWL